MLGDRDASVLRIRNGIRHQCFERTQVTERRRLYRDLRRTDDLAGPIENFHEQRQILIEHARRRGAAKRGANPDRVTLDRILVTNPARLYGFAG